MRRVLTSKSSPHAENLSPTEQAGRSWSESEPWGMRFGCQNHHPGAATSGLTILTVPYQTPARTKAGDSASTLTHGPIKLLSRMCKQRQQPCSRGRKRGCRV